MSRLKFNGKELPEFVKVTGYSFNIIPEIQYQSTSIPKRVGILDGGVEHNALTLSIDLLLVDSLNQNIHKQSQELKNWIRGNNWKLSRLEIPEIEEYHAMARITNTPEINDLITYGETNIEFTIPSGYFIKNYPTVIEGTGESAEISFSGMDSVAMNCMITLLTDSNSLTSRLSDMEFKVNGEFTVRDTILIDSDKKLVKVNDEINMDSIDVYSKWLYLNQGENKIEFFDDAGEPLQVIYKIEYTEII